MRTDENNSDRLKTQVKMDAYKWEKILTNYYVKTPSDLSWT